MLPMLVTAAATVAVTAPAQSACPAADPAITDLSAQLIKKSNAPDHYVITTTLSNIGSLGQTPDITQRVELLRNGVVLAPQTVPALDAGVAYPVAFAVYRPAAERSQPLTVTVRYVLQTGDATRNACNRANDQRTKTF